MIKIRSKDNVWVPASESQAAAFSEFKKLENKGFGGEKYEWDNGGVKSTIERIGDKFHGGTHITQEGIEPIPIADWNDVQVFLLDAPKVEWYRAYEYQTWAYYDYVYRGDAVRKYKTNGTDGHLDHIEIPVYGWSPDIVFSMGRNQNGTIYYEKNDAKKTQVRISDNHPARRAYYGFIDRLTMDPGMNVCD